MQARAMTLVETTAAVAVTGTALALLSPAMNSATVTTIRQADAMNLRTFGVAQASYEMDHQGRLASFSWATDQAGTPNWSSSFDDLDVSPGPFDPVSPSVWQAADIIRRGIGDDGTVIRRPSGFFPHRTHNHLVLMDYLGMSPLEAFAASPGDPRAMMVRDIYDSDLSPDAANFEARILFPNLVDMGGAGAGVRRMLPFMSSYLTVPFAWSPDKPGEDGIGSTNPATPADTTHWLYSMGTVAPRVVRSIDDVAFPGQKVFMYGSFDYASLRDQPIYYAFRGAKPAQVFFDGSAGTNATADANFGINPWNGEYANFIYNWNTSSEADYMPPAGVASLNGNPESPLVNGYYRWTAGGLQGIDFGGKPLDPFGLNLVDPHDR
jgi:type II secretory pathway pseudopilin PulG